MSLFSLRDASVGILSYNLTDLATKSSLSEMNLYGSCPYPALPKGGGGLIEEKLTFFWGGGPGGVLSATIQCSPDRCVDRSGSPCSGRRTFNDVGLNILNSSL